MSATTPSQPLINTPFIIHCVYLAYCDTKTSGDIIYSPFPEKNRTQRVIRTGIAVRCLVFTSIKDYSPTPIMTPVLCLIPPPLHQRHAFHSPYFVSSSSSSPSSILCVTCQVCPVIENLFYRI